MKVNEGTPKWSPLVNFCNPYMQLGLGGISPALPLVLSAGKGSGSGGEGSCGLSFAQPEWEGWELTPPHLVTPPTTSPPV